MIEKDATLFIELRPIQFVFILYLNIYIHTHRKLISLIPFESDDEDEV